MAKPINGSFEQWSQSVAAKHRNAEGPSGLMFKHLNAFASPSPQLLQQLAGARIQPNPRSTFENANMPAGFVFHMDTEGGNRR